MENYYEHAIPHGFQFSVLALIAEDLEGFVEDWSQLGEDRAATNAKALVMFHSRIRDAHPVDFPIDVRSIR